MQNKIKIRIKEDITIQVPESEFTTIDEFRHNVREMLQQDEDILTINDLNVEVISV